MLVAIDLETTGLNPGQHGIVSIAAKSEHGASFLALVIPDAYLELDPVALAKNGYDEQKWREQGATTLAEAMTELQRWLESLTNPRNIIAVAHNVGFDRRFLDWARDETGIYLDIGRRWECSQAAYGFLMRCRILPPGSTSLDSLGEASGYWARHPRSSEHQADEDAGCCLESYLWLQSLVLPKGRTFWQRLIYLLTGR
jgi:DNA polymerase III epsilon subunit-like protein